MRRFLGTFSAIVLLAMGACTQENKPEAKPTPAAQNARTGAAPLASATATATPSGPATASVKNAGLSWKDDASGTPVTTIKVGGTVTWTITSGTHSIERVAPSPANGCDELDASFDSETLTSGGTVTRTFTKPGTFGYHCGIHLGSPNCKAPPGTGRMPGVIKVVP